MAQTMRAADDTWRGCKRAALPATRGATIIRPYEAPLPVADGGLAGPRFERCISTCAEDEDPDQERLGIRRPDTGILSVPPRQRLAEAGHDVQIFLLGEAVTLMRTVVADAILPVGWPPLAQGLAGVVGHNVPIHV